MTGLPFENAYWVVPGRWLAGEYPGAPDAAATRERVAALAGLGIDAIVDLTLEGELPSYLDALPEGVRHVRLPIIDHGVPDDPSRMHEVLGQIEHWLGQGRCVYLHCRAGIGRTGMVVGCHLASTGRTGDAALDDLDRLWSKSARARSWPSIPETAEQRDYVYHWPAKGWPAKGAPVGDADGLGSDALAATRALRERYLGAMFGLAIADALAVATQFRKRGSFAPVGDLLGGGSFELPRGAWTDDTAMALCAAESFVGKRGFDPADQVQRLLRWQREGYLSATGQCVGITASVAKALASARWRRQRFAGSHDPAQQDPEVLARCVPAVLFGLADAQGAVELAVSSARITCQAPLALDAVRAAAAALHAALAGADKRTIVAAAGTPAAAVAAGSAAAVLRDALDVLGRAETFRDGVLECVNRGGASDVLAATYGAIAGAHHGAAALPVSWRKGLLRADTIEALADGLLACALESLAGD